MRIRFTLIIVLAGLLALVSCEEGNPLENQPPETSLFLDEIRLAGDSRLNSVVTLHWSGEDRDGYVTGYELSFDNMQWYFTESQDSTFRFPLNPGSDTTDIDFWVRAIDDRETRDPSPAYISVPIKNAPPTARFDTLKLIPDTVYSVFSVLWNVGDLDGDETVDSIFLRLNDGAWYPLPRNVNFVTVVPSEPEATGAQAANLYVGSNPVPEALLLEGLRVDGPNVLLLRARDIAGTFSRIDTTKSFFVRPQTSDLLVVDDHTASESDAVLLPILDATYPGYDLFRIANNIPPFWDPTFGRFLALYDKVFWYSDGSQNPDFGNQLFLEIAANQLQVYLNQGGKLFVSTRLPASFNGPEQNGVSAIFGFSPMDSLSSSSGQARIAVDSLLTPVEGLTGFPVLQNASFIIGADPFYAKDPSNILYTVGLTRTGGWTGPETVAGRTLGATGETNQVFFSVELHRFNKEPGRLEALINQVLNREFDW